MPLNKTFITILLFFAASSISVICIAQSSKKSRIRPVIPYNHPTLIAPPGMVYVPSGSTKINYSQTSTDTNSYRKVSLSAFFIDKTEVTNQQYRQFVNWVIDSIAVVAYLKDDKYFIQNESKNGDAGKTTTTAVTTPTPVATDSTGKVIDSGKIANAGIPVDSSIKKRIDWSKVDHDKIFNSKDEDIRSKIQPLLDENGNIKKEMYVFKFTYLRNVGSTNTKAKKNIYVTEPVSIYPDEKVWQTDLSNASVDLYVENYFKAPPFDDYPVVGVNWMQARAFCYWRSLTAGSYYNMPDYMKYYHFIYNLPSEGQWVYAAQGYYDMIADNNDTLKRHTIRLPSDSTVTPHDSAFIALQLQNNVEDSSYNAGIDERKRAAEGNLYVTDYFNSKKRKKVQYHLNGRDAVDSTPIHRDQFGLLSNFKQDEGDYTEDGAALTLPVMAFAPNDFGIYNMEGNVSEWVLDAYSPSAFSFVSDLNPALLYDADSSDADAMKRKVVRGGSFMSNANSLNPYYRDLELQNVSHCYLGFRCVVQAPEIIRKDVKTRGKTFKGKKAEGKFSHFRLPEIH
jgi:formylglycine-generating enzyme required for sulfatase activity